VGSYSGYVFQKMNGTELNGKPVYVHIDNGDYMYLFFKVYSRGGGGWTVGYNTDKDEGFDINDINPSKPTVWEEYANPDTEAECAETASSSTWQSFDWEQYDMVDDDTVGAGCIECKVYASQPECVKTTSTPTTTTAIPKDPCCNCCDDVWIGVGEVGSYSGYVFQKMNGTELNGKPVYVHIDNGDYMYLFFKVYSRGGGGWTVGYNTDKDEGFDINDINPSKPTVWEEYANPDTEAECAETASSSTWQSFDWEQYDMVDDDTVGAGCIECKVYASQPECGKTSHSCTGAGDGWTLVRHVPAGNNWHPAGDLLRGTDVYGYVYDLNRAFSFSFDFDDVDQFLFSSGDCQYWLIADKNELLDVSPNATKTILKSSTSNVPYTATWYGEGRYEDPWISLSDYPNDILYGGNGNQKHTQVIQQHFGANVYIRKGND